MGSRKGKTRLENGTKAVIKLVILHSEESIRNSNSLLREIKSCKSYKLIKNMTQIKFKIRLNSRWSLFAILNPFLIARYFRSVQNVDSFFAQKFQTQFSHTNYCVVPRGCVCVEGKKILFNCLGNTQHLHGSVTIFITPPAIWSGSQTVSTPGSALYCTSFPINSAAI